MYHCYLHSWSSLVDICPKCNPVETYTTTGTAVPSPKEYASITLPKDRAEEFFGMQIWKVFQAVQYAKEKGWKE